MARLGGVNTTDLLDAIRLGCRAMGRVFNADDHDIPFFESQVRPEAALRLHPAFSEAHVPGRHLNALLSAEHVTGIPSDEDAMGKHTRAMRLAYGGLVPLPLNRDRPGGLPGRNHEHVC